MNFDRASWIVRGARPFLAALAILSVLGLATQSASASVALSFNGSDALGGTQATTSLNSGIGQQFTIGNFTTDITASARDNSGLSDLTTTNITINNTSSTTDTLYLNVTGVGYSLGGTAYAGEAVAATFSLSGTGGPASTLTDTTTGSGWADTNNASFGTNTPFGTLTITPLTTTNTTTDYTSGQSPTSGTWAFNLGGSYFSLTQALAITLGAGNQANLTIITNLNPGEGTQAIVPEPSTLAIAGLGALGMMGYGLRRRKAQGA
ncbi:MAG TPA: PEP-CTERM sorting domain-containing protein [Isosphaeraceae bacterium]|nr:PEP-CTERM sorting domain-containing protein [Isosphaeraceae bacterium]